MKLERDNCSHPPIFRVPGSALQEDAASIRHEAQIENFCDFL